MLDNAMRITIDPVFPPPQFYNVKKFLSEKENKFEIIFDEQEEILVIKERQKLINITWFLFTIYSIKLSTIDLRVPNRFYLS